MSSERDARPPRGSASAPQAERSRGLYGRAEAAGPAHPAPGRSTLVGSLAPAPSGPRLSGDDEKVLLAALRLHVPEGDHVRAWDRFDRFMSWLPRLSPAGRQHLLLRLERPVPADELARLFHQVLSPAWRTKALEHLRSGGGAAAARQAQAPSPAQGQAPSPAQAQAPGNPGRIQDMLMGWVDKMKSAWEHRGQLADKFLEKWNAPSGWDRGQFQGEVLGWVMMTVLIILATAGAGAAANASSLAARFPQVIQLLKTVDAVGDVTTYLGGALHGLKAAGKLPDAASDLVKSKLGKTASTETGATARNDSIKHGGDERSLSNTGLRGASDLGRTVSQRSVQLLGQSHTLRVVDRGNGAFSLVLCSDCAFVLKEIDAVLGQTTAKGPTKSLRVRLERLRAKVVELEKKMSTGDMKQTEGIPQPDQIAAHLVDISRKFPSANPLCVFCAFKGQINYDLIAKNLDSSVSEHAPMVSRSTDEAASSSRTM
jgi:hypothetical protein